MYRPPSIPRYPPHHAKEYLPPRVPTPTPMVAHRGVKSVAYDLKCPECEIIFHIMGSWDYAARFKAGDHIYLCMRKASQREGK